MKLRDVQPGEFFTIPNSDGLYEKIIPQNHPLDKQMGWRKLLNARVIHEPSDEDDSFIPYIVRGSLMEGHMVRFGDAREVTVVSFG